MEFFEFCQNLGRGIRQPQFERVRIAVCPAPGVVGRTSDLFGVRRCCADEVVNESTTPLTLALKHFGSWQTEGNPLAPVLTRWHDLSPQLTPDPHDGSGVIPEHWPRPASAVQDWAMATDA
jgi:hypothetical protein